MKVYDLLLDRHAGGVGRRHDVGIAIDARNRRWCSSANSRWRTRIPRVRAVMAPLTRLSKKVASTMPSRLPPSKEWPR